MLGSRTAGGDAATRRQRARSGHAAPRVPLPAAHSAAMPMFKCEEPAGAIFLAWGGLRLVGDGRGGLRPVESASSWVYKLTDFKLWPI
jgi:hypothetical protein